MGRQKSTLSDFRGIYYESTNWEHCFYVSNWRRDRHFTWSSEPLEGLAACSKKEVPSFLSYFEDTENWSGPGNRTRDLPLCSQALNQLSLSCQGM